MEGKFIIPGRQVYEGQVFHGEISVETIEKAQHLYYGKGDVVVTGFPKSGNTWLWNIVYVIMNANNLEKYEKDGASSGVGGIEWDNSASDKPRPNLYVTHLLPKLLPKDILSGEVKVINIVREPKDVCVSYYYHSKIYLPFGMQAFTWESYFDSFLKGEVPFGSWGTFVQSWMPYVGQDNIKFIQYEELKKNPYSMIVMMARFLEKPLDDTTIDKIVKLTSFEAMKNHPKFVFAPKFDLKKGSFFRKGDIADWRSHFTQSQKEAFDAQFGDIYSSFITMIDS